MNGLIKINIETSEPTVSARELHGGLEITDRFSRWFERMSAYGFENGKDFTSVKSSTLVNNGAEIELLDYNITVDMAKQICMIQRSKKGKQYREYFLEIERAWNSPEQVMARALKMADKTITGLQADVKRMKPKEVFADAVSSSNQSILVGELAKLLKQNGVDIGEKRLFQWLRNNGYLIKRNGTDYNMPTQRSMELGLFKIKETVVTHSDGHVTVHKTTKVTGKGQQYFINKFLPQDRETSKKVMEV